MLKFQVLLKESLFLRLIVPSCLIHQQHTDRLCVCVCKRIPEHSPPKSLQTMSVQVGEREREGGRNLTWHWTKREKRRERGGEKEERKISLLCSCRHGNPPDNTYSLCHSGMKESDELSPPSSFPSEKTHTRHVKTTLAFPPLLFPVGALSLYLKERQNTQSV